MTVEFDLQIDKEEPSVQAEFPPVVYVAEKAQPRQNTRQKYSLADMTVEEAAEIDAYLTNLRAAYAPRIEEVQIPTILADPAILSKEEFERIYGAIPSELERLNLNQVWTLASPEQRQYKFASLDELVPGGGVKGVCWTVDPKTKQLSSLENATLYFIKGDFETKMRLSIEHKQRPGERVSPQPELQVQEETTSLNHVLAQPIALARGLMSELNDRRFGASVKQVD